MMHLREKWPWNTEFLRVFLIIPSLIGIVMTGIFYIFSGVQALWFLSAILVGVVLRLIYSAVGQRVTRLKAEYSEDPGEVVEGLLVIGGIQSPGVAILRSHELKLVPIVGEGCTIGLDELEVLKEGRMLPGKYVWGKRAFILKSQLHKRIAFAVPESVGERWSRVFSRA